MKMHPKVSEFQLLKIHLIIHKMRFGSLLFLELHVCKTKICWNPLIPT